MSLIVSGAFIAGTAHADACDSFLQDNSSLVTGPMKSQQGAGKDKYDLRLCDNAETHILASAEDSVVDTVDSATVAENMSAASEPTDASRHEINASMARNYPTLADRNLGDAVKDADGEKKIWPHVMPFFGQKILDLGVEFPAPYGFAAMITSVRQDLIINELAVSKTGPDGPYIPTPFVGFDNTTSEAADVEIKLDTWLFPFMNVFGVMGYVDGSASIPISVGVEGALDFLDLGGICPDVPPAPAFLRPGFCDDSISFTVESQYTGTNYGVGTVLAMGWDNYFVAIPITYVFSDLSNLNSTIETYSGEVLLGHTTHLAKDSSVQVFIGGSYLKADQNITNTYTIPLSQADPSLPDVEIDYQIKTVNKDRWNLAVGGQYQINKNWDILFQAGFLGTRKQLTVGGNVRW